MPATYVAEPKLTIDGQPASDKLLEDILQISIEESLHLPSMFTIVLQNSKHPGRVNQEMWEHADTLGMGKEVKLGFASSITEASEFEDRKEDWLILGEITAIETHFTSGSQAPIIVRGYDRSHRLHRGTHNRSFQKMSDTDIVKKIIAEVGIQAEGATYNEGNIVSAGSIDSTSPVHDYVFQENQTNMEFLRERAARNGYELFIQDGKLHFHKPRKESGLSMKWLQDLTSFRVRVSSAEQVQSVEVRGWDYKQKRPIVGTANQGTILTSTDHGKGAASSTKFGSSPKLTVVDQPIHSSTEADTMAKALFHELSDEFVQADAQAQGNPQIRPGRVVALEGMGKYSGNYYITETHHLFSERVYSTAFSVRGLRGGDLLSLLSPPARSQAGQTLLIGIVTNNQDSENMGRVRVKLPTLTEEHESNWARVVTIGAGKDRGFDCLPEINDEVLVGFEHGDIHRPFVIGGLWNGKDSPSEPVTNSVEGGNVRLRTFKTRVGHQLQFVESDKGSSKKGVIVKTVGGHEMNYNDSDKFVEIKTTAGHTVKMTDREKSIEITTTGGHTVKMGDTDRKISLTSTGEITLSAIQKITLMVGGSSVEITPTGVKVQGTATADVQAATTNVKGMALVQVQAALVKIN
jgi:phage protein D